MSAKLDRSDRAETEFIPPWIGGKKLISVLDVKEYLANRLVAISGCLTNCMLISMHIGDEMTQKNRNDLNDYLNTMDQELKFLGLEMTRLSVVRTKSKTATIKSDELLNEMGDIESRFDDEIRSLRFFYLPTDRLQYFSKTDLFGEEFKSLWPTANVEISEAGNCFALARFTACAFHLMRSLEVVLKVLFRELKLPPLTTAEARNWNGILREIRDKLEADKTIPDHAFYDGAYAFLAAAKNPMRNATMHVDAVYDESSARSLFDAIGAFMRHVATKLKES